MIGGGRWWGAIVHPTLLLVLLVSVRAEGATLLRSPWDVAPRRVIAAAYSCPPLAPLPRDVVAADYYADPRHSEVDAARFAAYQAAQAPFTRVMQETARAADTFQRIGSRAAARCVMDLLLAAARAGAMLGRVSSNQAVYLQGWTVGALALAYLKARTAGTADLGETAAIVRWLVDVAAFGVRYMDQRRALPQATDGRNNHAAWMGLAVMAVGVANNDDVMFGWGEERFRDQAAQVAADGTLPLELARGARALHYHLFAAEPMLEMAVFGEANGVDLFGVGDHALGRLIGACLLGRSESGFFARLAGVAQESTGSAAFAWAWPFARRFPGTALDEMGREAMFRPVLYLGGLPAQ